MKGKTNKALLASILVGLVFLVGCGGGGSPSSAPPPPTQVAPAITSASSATFAQATSGSFAVTATGTPTPTITESGALPGGVTFNAGILSGTPTTSGSFPITFTMSNGVSPNAVQSFVLTVTPPPPTITSASVSCIPTSVQTGQTSQCTATVTGTGNYSSTVTWGASAGTINSSGLFTAPATASTVTVTATSTQDTSKTGNTTVTVTAGALALLQGQYAFTLEDSTNSLGLYGMIGEFTADGMGNLTSGYIQINDTYVPDNSNLFTFTGSYQMGPDGRGTLTFGDVTQGIPVSGEFATEYAFVLNLAGTEGRVVSTNGRPISGQLYEQDLSQFSNAGFAGNYTYRFRGMESSTNPYGTVTTSSSIGVGVFTADGKGNISDSEFDYYSTNTGLLPTFSGYVGTYNMCCISGLGVIQSPAYLLGGGEASVVFVSASKILFALAIGNGNGGYEYIGEADLQSGAPFSTASISGGYVFGVAGPSSQVAGGTSFLAGRFTADGQGGIANGEEDAIDGQPTLVDAPFNGAFSLAANGRGTLTFGTLSFIFYSVSASQAFLLSTVSGDESGGELHGQENGPFDIAGSYIFSFTGTSDGPQLVASGQLESGEASVISSGTVDSNFLGTDSPLIGTYSSISSSGRGTANVSTATGSLDFVFYAASSSEITLIGVNADVLGSAKKQQP